MSALAEFLFSHIFVIAGGVTLASLFASFYRRQDQFDLDFDDSPRHRRSQATSHKIAQQGPFHA